MFRPLMLIAPLVLVTGLAACDGEDYEAQVGELQGQLETARGESDQMRTELEEAQARVAELEESQAQGQAGAAPASEEMRAPIETALSALAESDQQLDAAAQSASAPESVDVEALNEVRNSIRRAAEAVGEVARAVGIEPESVAPAQQ